MSCGVSHRLGSDPTLLWLWRRPVATAPFGPLAWEPPYAEGVAQEMAKRQKKESFIQYVIPLITVITQESIFLWHLPCYQFG